MEKSTNTTKEKKSHKKQSPDAAAPVVWSAIPQVPEGYVWTRQTPVFQQKFTKHYYSVPEVLSSIEKSILIGDLETAMFFTIEYVSMGIQFVSPVWNLLFHIATNSVGLESHELVAELWKQYSAYKSFLPLSESKKAAIKNAAKGEQEEENAADDEDEEEDLEEGQLSARCINTLLVCVRHLCQVPKCRLIDSAVRTFFLPYPSSTQYRGYEPHKDLVHLKPTTPEGEGTEGTEGEGVATPPTYSSTRIQSTSYVDEYVAGQKPGYTLYPLDESDPPYLAPWCNGLVHILNQVRDFTLPVDDDQFAELAIQQFTTLEKGALYFAGLIYQCSEPCLRSKKINSVYILWDIIEKYKTDEIKDAIGALRLASDEFSKNDNRKERAFVVQAILTIVRSAFIDYEKDQKINEEKVDLKAALEENATTTYEINENALDYTTKEGKLRRATVIDYIQLLHDMVESNKMEASKMEANKTGASNADGIADIYWESAHHLESARTKEQFKDGKKVFESQIDFLRFLPEKKKTTPTVAGATGAEGAEEDSNGANGPNGPDTKTGGKGRKKKTKNPEDFDLSKYHVIPREWYSDHEAIASGEKPARKLPWTGEFIPFAPATLEEGGVYASVSSPIEECLTDIKPVLNHKLKEGLFTATFNSGIFESEQVLFIPCAGPLGAKQVYYQCLLDEMKPLFGVPKLGTHCIYTDGFLDKIDKKLEWNPDNVTISDEHGCHVVMFPATALGFFPSQEGGTNEKGEDVVVEVPAEIPDQLDGFTVDVLTTPFVKKTRAPFLTTDFTSIRHQVMNIYMFYLCMGVSKGSLTNMFLKSVTGNTIDLRTEGAKGAEGSKGSDPEGEEGETNHPGGTAPSDEDMQEAMNAMVVPFYELTAFTNLSFPEIFKRLRQPLLQQLIINDQKYFMLRFFDLLMFLNFDAMETILQKFGAPVGEYISTIRNNLRDVRCGWLLYSQHAQDAIEETKQKAQEKNRIRNETKKAEAALLADAKDEKTTKKVTKKRTKPTAATAAKEDPVEDGESNEEQAVEVEDPSGEVEDPEETKPKKKSVKKAKTTSSTTKDEKVEKAPVAATKKASETKKVEKVTKVTKVTNVTKAVDKVKTNVNAEAPKKKKPVEKRDLDTDNAVPPSAPKKTKVVASKK